MLSESEFLPSTLEHRPLKDVEKKMLLRHFAGSGSEDLDALRHWEWADGEDLRLLEAWVWGMRHFGRETLFRLALYGFLYCKARWDKAEVEVGTVQMGRGASLPEMLALCLRWAKLPGQEVAEAIVALRGDPPDAWIAAEVPEDQQRGPAACAILACDRMAGAVLLPRDEAARMAGQALVCAALSLMASGRDEAEACAVVRAFVVKEMRVWFGRAYHRG